MSHGYFVGPIPTKWFFRHFMHSADGAIPVPRANFSAVREARDADTMRLKLVTAIHRHGLAPGLEYIATLRDEQAEMEAGPSTSTTAVGLGEAVPSIYARPKREGSTAPRTMRGIPLEALDFYTACLPIEVRADDSSDPFLDPLDYNDHLRTTVGPYTFAWYDDTREATRTALAAQARELMHRQQRVCVLQLVLCGRHARLLRWDRGGAVVTERFAYAAAAGVLAEFLWRYAHLPAAARGWDDTAGPPNAREAGLFRAAVQRFLKAHAGGARTVPQGEVTLDAAYPVWRVRVADEHSGAATVLIVQRPFHTSGGVLGRATRGYLAYDVRARRVTFFKDTWRPGYTRRLGAEAGTYHTLREHGVQHLPKVLYACDVRDGGGELQQTRSYGIAHMNPAWDQRTERSGELVHHRVVQEIAYPLQQALDEREYVQVLHDAAVAVGTAHAQANLLHRDLSLNNVMITSEGRGVLNDWDMAGRDTTSIYVGTWTYMSIGILQNPKKRHDVLDDYESLYWILQFGVMTRYLAEGAEPEMNIFDEMERNDANTHWIGGTKKLEWVLTSEGRVIPCTSAPLRQLVADMDAAWRRYYQLQADHTGKEAEWEKVQARYKTAAFWGHIFEQALEKFPQPMKRGRKRKAEPMEPPRRSKRLKILRGED
ncbi:hypothetical protein PHLGIDRAFT_508988 [Phlebiopsis gigantea 11061_1 CR5-6]|uniref:Protein kinase domain-containing protein n=1 Tax=Phlebiopsis gigantea (strain 11061_1 CR5-6) TaxID=745531 RepID=A0A0C3SBY6_PHLG1|nr:hypothetical protein PHLGIDRAFT_508988 [Phlebiopsis gigantea 11061_1 CR5-6]